MGMKSFDDPDAFDEALAITEESVRIQCCKTPILDLLRRTPVDGRATHKEGEGVSLTYHMIPYGHHCHEAADEIERLNLENENLKAAISDVRDAIHGWEDGGEDE